MKRNLSLSRSEILELQRKKLVGLVRHAYENVPFYHRKFDEAGLKPCDIWSLDDLAQVPVVTKAEIQSCPISDMLARGVDLSDCQAMKTSGSTGRRLHLYIDRGAADYRFALMARTYWEDGLRPWNRMAIVHVPPSLRSYTMPRYRGVVRRLHLSVLDSVDKQLEILEEYRPDFLESYPSSLVPIARACVERRVNIRPRLVLTGSELLLPGDAETIRSAFQCDSVDDYGCLELGPLAWECREHAGYHMNVDGVAMEFLDEDGVPVAPGERGMIACTGLVSYSMPFIRYMIDDSGVPSSEECACGRPLPLMKMVEGRKDDFLTAMDGRIVPPLAFGTPWFLGDIVTLKEYRVIQLSRDRVVVEIAGPQSLDKEWILESGKRVRSVMGEGVEVDFELVNQLERDAGGKLRKIISHVPVIWNN